MCKILHTLVVPIGGGAPKTSLQFFFNSSLSASSELRRFRLLMVITDGRLKVEP